MLQQSPIAVLGAGSWGTALALQLAANGNLVQLWSHQPSQVEKMQTQRENSDYLPGYPFPENIEVFSELSLCLHEVQDVLIVVPSHAFANVIKQIKLYHANPRLVWGTKGLDPTSGKLLHQIVELEFNPLLPMAVLSGPSFAKEVAAGLPTAVSLAANNSKFTHDLIERFHSKFFRVYENTDIIGVQLCGTLKNVLAIAVGIADGLQLGANARCALITRGLAEMKRLNQVLGGQSETLMSLAGIGDLVLTCTDNQSRNRRFGLALGQGDNIEQAIKNIGQAVEGFSNTQQVYQLAQQYHIEMPIISQVYAVLHHNASPEQALLNLLQRVPGKIES